MTSTIDTTRVGFGARVAVVGGGVEAGGAEVQLLLLLLLLLLLWLLLLLLLLLLVAGGARAGAGVADGGAVDAATTTTIPTDIKLLARSNEGVVLLMHSLQRSSGQLQLLLGIDVLGVAFTEEPACLCRLGCPCCWADCAVRHMLRLGQHAHLLPELIVRCRHGTEQEAQQTQLRQ